MPTPAPEAIRAALARGPATPDVLASRLGGIDRDVLMWAVDELVREGSVDCSADAGCGPEGICSTGVPTVYSLPA